MIDLFRSSVRIGPPRCFQLGRSRRDQAGSLGVWDEETRMARLVASGLVVVVLMLFGSTSVGAAPRSQPLGPSSTISVGSSPYGVAVNPTTNTIYVTNLLSNNVSVINGATNLVTATIAVGTSPNGIAVDPKTNVIYVAHSGGSTV